MQILNLVQGTPEWKAARAEYFTASEAPAMKGTSKYKTRDKLIHEKATGDEENFDEFTLKLFAKGHEIEALARPIAEKLIGEDLFPATGVDIIDRIRLLASFDGLTMDQSIIWECKSWNEGKVLTMKDGVVPPTDYWQVVQQLVLSGAEKCLYMVTDGTEEKTVHLWIGIGKDDRAELLGGWEQFAEDLKDYTPPEVKAKGVSSAIMELPALKIEINGEVKSSNLAIYQESAEKFIGSINTDLKTDNDFATAETTVKFCDAAEKRLEQVKEQALEQTADISELFKTINFLKEQIREKRLLCTNAIKTKKSEIKMSIATAAKNDFIAYQTETNNNLGGAYVFVETDFNAAMKGKKTIDSLQSAANDEVANCKIKANELAQKIQYNLEMIHDDWEFLFADKAQIVTKENDDFRLLVDDRIEKHKAEEKRKADEKQKADDLAAAMELENKGAEGDDSTLDIEDEITEKSGEVMSGYPVDDNVGTLSENGSPIGVITDIKIEPDSWKIVAKSLQENGIGLKSANKIARLIVDGKIDCVGFNAGSGVGSNGK